MHIRLRVLATHLIPLGLEVSICVLETLCRTHLVNAARV